MEYRIGNATFKIKTENTFREIQEFEKIQEEMGKGSLTPKILKAIVNIILEQTNDAEYDVLDITDVTFSKALAEYTETKKIDGKWDKIFEELSQAEIKAEQELKDIIDYEIDIIEPKVSNIAIALHEAGLGFFDYDMNYEDVLAILYYTRLKQLNSIRISIAQHKGMSKWTET